MNIYNCIVSELQHFVTQPLILPILRAVKLHMHILNSRKLFKMLDFHRSHHIRTYVHMPTHIESDLDYLHRGIGDTGSSDGTD